MRSVTRDFLRMLGFAWRASPTYSIVMVVLLAVQSAASPASVWALMAYVSLLSTTGRPLLTVAHIAISAALVGGLNLFGAILREVQKPLSAVHRELAFGVVREAVMVKALSIDLATLESAEMRDTVHRANSDVPDWINGWEFAVQQIGTMISVVGYGAVLARVNIVVPIIIAVCALPALFFDPYSTRASRYLFGGSTRDQRLLSYYVDLCTTRAFAEEVRLFGLHAVFRERWRVLHRSLEGVMRRLQVQVQSRAVATVLARVIGYAAALAFLVGGMQGGRITLGVAVGTLVAMEAMQGSLEAGLQRFNDLVRVVVAIGQRHFTLLDVPTATAAPNIAMARSTSTEEQVLMDTGASQDHRIIELAGVSFTYPDNTPAVRNVSFSVRDGEMLCLVGPNGAGKSTIMKLLLGLYDPSQGTYLFGDVRRGPPGCGAGLERGGSPVGYARRRTPASPGGKCSRVGETGRDGD